MTHIDHSKYKIYNEFLHWHNSCPVYKKMFRSRVPEPLLPTDIHIIRNASNEAENDIKNIKEELYNSENVAFLSLLWFGELLWKPLDCFLSLKNKHTHTGVLAVSQYDQSHYESVEEDTASISVVEAKPASQTGVQFHTINCLPDKQFHSSFMKINGILCLVGSHHSGLDHKNNFSVTQHMLKDAVRFDWFYT